MRKTRLVIIMAVLFLVAFITTFNYGGCNPPTGDGGGSSGSSETTTPPPVTLYPPNAPSSLVANTVSSSQINLTWTDSDIEYGFSIERSSGSGFIEIIRTGTNVTNYSNTGLSASTTYYYRVRAYNAAGYSSYSNEVFTTTQAQQPVQVTSPSPGDGATGVSITTTSLSWAPAIGTTVYDVYFGTTGTPPYQYNTTGANYNPGILSISTTYYWRIDSKNSVGTTAGNVWSFTTGSSVSASENPLGATPLSEQEYQNIPVISADSGGGLLPTSWSLKANMPSPRDQGGVKSCTAWAIGYALKSYQEQVERNWGLNTDSHLFSPAYIYNQMNGGQNIPTSPALALDLLASQGCATLATMPNQNDLTTQPSLEARVEASAYKIKAKFRIEYKSLSDFTNNIKTFLSSGNPIVVLIKAYSNINPTIAAPYIYNSTTANLLGYHTVILTGYNDEKGANGAYEFINSWGTRWGEGGDTNNGGYAWIDYNFLPSICIEAYYTQDYIETIKTGAIYVSSDPTGVGVYLDGSYAGTAPLTIPAVSVGSHTVKVTKDGYKTQEIATTVIENQTKNMVVTLEIVLSLPDQVVLSAPSNNSINRPINQQLSWNSAAGATSYDVRFGTSNPPSYVTNTTELSYNPGTLSNSTTYYWRIDSRNSAGPTTGIVWSFTTVAVDTIPNSPINGYLLTSNSYDMQFTWTDNSNNETGFKVRRKISGGTYSVIATLSANTESYYDSGPLTPYTLYYYQVYAYNSAGNSLALEGSLRTFPESGSVTYNGPIAPSAWVVPAGVTSIQIDAKGASGGAGGKGARVRTTLSVTPGETLYFCVGGVGNSNSYGTAGAGGYNGGGNGGSSTYLAGFGGYGGYGGGGASDIRRGGTALSNRVVVAGGGGGSAGYTSDVGGNGGQNGTNGQDNSTWGTGGGVGGTQSAGGRFGSVGTNGSAGSSGQGGAGGSYFNTTYSYGGGGGGGGYYGGGGGAGSNNTGSDGGGGGGSSYSTGTGTTYTSGYRSGNGQIIITY
ncbi:MAG: PEGA domain-containing protein [Planctomycetota bacterium]